MIETMGSRMKEYRQAKNLSQKQFALLIGVERAAISQYENDMRKPSYEVLIKIAEVLGVSTDELLGKRKMQTIDVSGLGISDLMFVIELVERLKKNYE